MFIVLSLHAEKYDDDFFEKVLSDFVDLRLLLVKCSMIIKLNPDGAGWDITRR